MNGLEILLFGALVIFVLANFSIRFLVRKLRSDRKAVSAGEEAEVQNRLPDVPLPRQIGGTSDAGAVENADLFYPVGGIMDDGVVREEVERETGRVPAERSGEKETGKKAARFAGEEKRPGVGSGMEEYAKRFRGTIEINKETEARGKTFWERVDTLPPLQRAIVLSEVLGPSKGIDS